MTRLERFRKLCEYHGVEPGNRHTTAGEDTGMYFLPESDEDHKPVRRWVAVTETGEFAYLYADFDTRAEAQLKAIENVNDSLYAETPLAVYDLDDEVKYTPRWASLRWAKSDA